MLHFLFHSGSSSGTNSSSKESYELLHGLEKPSPEIKDLSFRFVLVQDIGDRKKTILFDSKYSDYEGHETQLRDSSHAPLTDLMFGAIPMSQKNTVTKLHVLQSPSSSVKEYMLTQLFQINLCGPVETPGNDIGGEENSFEEQGVNKHKDVGLSASNTKTENSTQRDGETAKPRSDDQIDESRSVVSEKDEKGTRKEPKISPKRKNNITTTSSSSLLHDQMEKLLSIRPSVKERPRPSRLTSYSPRSSSPISISHPSASVPDALPNYNSLLGTRKLNGSSYSVNKETGNLMENMRRRRKNRPPPINLSTSSLSGAGGTLSPFLFTETRTRPSTYALALIITVPITYETTVHPLTFYWSLFSNATKSLKTDIDNHIRELLCVSLSNSSNHNENAIPLIQSTSSKVGFGSYSLQKDTFTITKMQQCLRILRTGISAPLIQPSVFSSDTWMENIKILEGSCRNEKQKMFISTLLTLAMKMSRLKKTEKTPCKIMIQSSRAPIARRFLYILAPLLRPSLVTSSTDILEPNLLFPSSGMLSSQSMPTTSNNTGDILSLNVPNSSQAIDIRSSKSSNHSISRKSSLRNYLGSSWRFKFMRSSYQSSPTGPESSGGVSSSSSRQRQQQQSFGSFSPYSSDFTFGSDCYGGLEYLDNVNANKEVLKGLPKTRLVPNGMLQVDLPMIDSNCDSARTRLPKLGPSVSQAGFLTYLHPCFDLQAAPLDAYIIPNREEFFSSTLTSMLETNMTPKKENDTNLYSRIAVANIDECNIQCYELCEVPVMDDCSTQNGEGFAPKLNYNIFRETIMTSFNVSHGCFYSLKRSYGLYDYNYVDDEFVNIALAGNLESVFDYINKEDI